MHGRLGGVEALCGKGWRRYGKSTCQCYGCLSLRSVHIAELTVYVPSSVSGRRWIGLDLETDNPCNLNSCRTMKGCG